MTATLEPSTAETNRDDFAELSRRVRETGLLGRRRTYYWVKITTTVGALIGFGIAAVVIGDSWWNLAVAVGVAFVLTQLGFIGHDAGHRQIFVRQQHNAVVGLVMINLLTGFSFGWWLHKHNRHHAHTNRPDKDPDTAPGALVYEPSQVEGRGRVGRVYASIQVVLLIPLLFLEALNLHISSAASLIRRHDRGALLEAGLLAVHAAVFFVAPFLLLSPLRAVVFIVLTQCLLGFYLGVTFITNHVGMPMLGGPDELGFLRRQVITSRNLSGRSFTGFIFGGLDTQIEHHLFPTMPRANLRRARALVRPFCDERQIAYVEQSPWGAYRAVLRHLHAAGSGRMTPVVR